MVHYSGHALVEGSVLVGRKTLKKPFLRREMAFSYTSSSYFFKQHKQHYVSKAIQTLGRKMAESSDFAKNAKKAKKCIFLVDPYGTH